MKLNRPAKVDQLLRRIKIERAGAEPRYYDNPTEASYTRLGNLIGSGDWRCSLESVPVTGGEYIKILYSHE